jgi:uncharacterized repeat protein (TIGR03803 family)
MKTLVGIGLAFLLTAAAWAQTEQTVLTFTGSNGSGPLTGFIQDAKGNFYGAASNGGTTGAGVVYKLTRNAKGKWKQKILYNLLNNGVDGAYPQMPFLAMDKHGALYGTASNGGANGNGIVFKLSPGRPQWKETILHTFTGNGDGGQPIGGVTVDSKGNLYGTTFTGGDPTNCYAGCGVVYELSPGKKGAWTYTVLHTFEGIPASPQCEAYDGRNPTRVTLVLDAAGNIYGATTLGGYGCSDVGTISELSPAGGGNWTYSLLYLFGVNGAGWPFGTPNGGVILDSQGNLYATDGEGDVAEFVKAQGYAAQIPFQWVGCVGNCPSGDYDTVTMDKAGNLFWTSASGPNPNGDNVGGVYELSPNGQGGWNPLTVLYAFPPNPATEGKQPWAPVMVDASGNLYGTCSAGGGSQGSANGTVWEITP